ncbi:MAG: adenylate/guanylate cyclase domain-containing protein [Acidimicrobiia bacterium]
MTATKGEYAHERRKHWLKIHAGVYLVVNGFFVGTWLMVQGIPDIEDPNIEMFFPGWLLLIWGVCLGFHAVVVWARRPQVRPLAMRSGGQAGRVVSTVLFTDIVGSTELAAGLGDRRWAEVLDLHDRTSRRVVVDNGGQVVKQTGDGTLATFDTPNQAIAAAWALREELGQQDLLIRAGLHSGEIELRRRDVGGIAVHIASRVMGAAAPGEILVSRTVRDLVGGSKVEFSDRGASPLRGLEGEWELYAVDAL